MKELMENLSTDLELRALRWAESERTVNIKLREALHDLLGHLHECDPDVDGPINLEISGAAIRKAQAVLAEVE